VISESRRRRQRGLTFIELLTAAAILAILAGIAMPTLRWEEKRRKEVQLRMSLESMRNAIDQHKKYFDEGRIQQEDVEQMGYPLSLEQLVEGVEMTGEEALSKKTIKFLRRIPVDPFTGEATWGMRSYQDDWDSDSWGGENIYDVYSLSDRKALDGTYYKDW
jgi:general secretion pathway protein G